MGQKTSPEGGKEGGQLAAAAKVVDFPGNQVPGAARLGVKVGMIRLRRRVDGHQHPLVLILPLKDELMILLHYRFIAPILQGLTVGKRLGASGNPLGQVILFGLLKAGTQGRVAVLLFPLGAPLAAVIDTGNAGHSEEQAVDGLQMPGLGENAGHPSNVVIIHEIQQVLALIQGPVFRAELPV